MEATKDQSRRAVENGERTGDEKVKLTGIVAEPRGRGAELAADVEREAWNAGDAWNSEQTGRPRRRVGTAGVN